MNTLFLKRAVTIAGGLAVAVLAFVAFSAARGDSSGEYEIRAIFTDAGGIVNGSDVRVAGANVGVVKSLDVAEGNKAGIIISIADPAFKPFYKNAKCSIRLQSLIGEKAIDCKPGTPGAGELGEDPGNEGVRFLPESNTAPLVDFGNVSEEIRLPEQQRLRIIFSSFGLGFAGRGQDINDALGSADPAFKEFGELLALLAKQNKVLAKLAKDGDTSVRTLARERKHLTHALKSADSIQSAVAARRDELRATFSKFPALLDELEPTSRRLKELSIAAQPVARQARAGAKDFSTFIANLGPFADASTKGLKSTATFTKEIQDQVPVLLPLAQDLRGIGAQYKGVKSLNDLLGSFKDQGGIENLLTMTFGLVGAANGFDGFGHFVRSTVSYDLCYLLQIPRDRSCSRDFAGDQPWQDTKNGGPGIDVDSIEANSSGKAAALDYLLGGER